MNNGKAIIFSAPSGAGKTTIVHHLLNVVELKLSFSVSATSRPKRDHEREGRDYYFISSEEFRNRIDRNEFLEWQEVYPDQYYGTLKADIERIWEEGRNAIFDVDVVGGLNLKKIFGTKGFAVFVQPPSVEVLLFRLRNRSTETADKIATRIKKAQLEMSFAPQFDWVLINDELDAALIAAEERVREFLYP